MIRRGLLLLVGALVLVLFTGRDAGAAAPTEQLRESVNRVLKVLEDPDLRTERRTRERRAALRTIAGDAFDLEEMTKRALARHWQARSPAEREEFRRLFLSLLERAYVSRIELYQGERISYVGESVEGDQATVRTRILTRQGTDIPVDYRMHRRGDRWRVYDVGVEGISLVANYRAQFDKIIRTSSYQELVAKMRAKETERPGGANTKRTAAP